MFGIGMTELIVIIVIAIIVLGASPKLARKFGITLKELKKGLKEGVAEEKSNK